MVCTFWVVVLDSDETIAGLGHVLQNGLPVQGLDGEDVNDAQTLAGGLLELARRLERLVQRDAAADHGAHVRVALAHHLGLADGERLVVGVDDGRVGPTRAYVADALGVGGELDGALGRDGIARIEDAGVRHRAEHGQVLECHLAGTVLADRAADVRAAEVHVRLRDGAHADLIECARPEGSERARECHAAAACRHADRYSSEILLGNETLNKSFIRRNVETKILEHMQNVKKTNILIIDKPFRKGLLELDRVRRVLDITIERNDLRVRLAELDKTSAVGETCGDLFAELVAGRRGELDLGGDGRRHTLQVGRLDGQQFVRQLARFVDNVRLDRLAHLGRLLAERLAVPRLVVLDLRKELALEGLGDDARGLALVRGSLVQRVRDGRDVVAVDDERVPAEGLGALAVHLDVVLVHGRLALAETIHIDDVHQVVELVVAGERHRLPHAALGTLAITADAVHSIADDENYFDDII